MISITEVRQDRVEGTSRVKVSNISRFHVPFNTLDEYMLTRDQYNHLNLTYCRHTKRYTVESETHRIFIFDSEEFGSHWQGRKIDLSVKGNYKPITLVLA